MPISHLLVAAVAEDVTGLDPLDRGTVEDRPADVAMTTTTDGVHRQVAMMVVGMNTDAVRLPATIAVVHLSLTTGVGAVRLEVHAMTTVALHAAEATVTRAAMEDHHPDVVDTVVIPVTPDVSRAASRVAIMVAREARLEVSVAAAATMEATNVVGATRHGRKQATIDQQLTRALHNTCTETQMLLTFFLRVCVPHHDDNGRTLTVLVSFISEFVPLTRISKA